MYICADSVDSDQILRGTVRLWPDLPFLRYILYAWSINRMDLYKVPDKYVKELQNYIR